MRNDFLWVVKSGKYLQDSITPYVSSSTAYVRADIASGVLLRGAAGSTFRIKLRKPDGQEPVCSLTHAKATDSVLYPNPGVYLDEQKRGVFQWKTLPNQIAYVALNSFASESRVDSLFENILSSLSQARGVIVDLRYNGGGDDGVAFNILRYFIQDSVLVAASSVYRTFNPYLKAIGR